MCTFRVVILVLSAVSAGFCSPLGANHTFSQVFHQVAVQEEQHNPDYGLDIKQLLDKYKYPLESHEVTTEDGYILTLHRIPYGDNDLRKDENSKRPAILLMHPLLSSSVDMINLGPHKSIGLLLADEGYDVWMGNIRGNTWSRRHVKWDADKDKEFWDFSFEDGGLYDMPATIDYILNVTGQEKITYLGHSQGTSVFFAMTTLKPEYNDKINFMVAFAPVAYLDNITQPLIRFLADFYFFIDPLADQLNINELLPHTTIIPQLVKVMCCDGCALQDVCDQFIQFLVGPDPSQVNKSFIEVIGTNTPAGASTKMIKHFTQEIRSGHFRRYDYGTVENLLRYGNISPPDFDLSLIRIPVALYWGGQDAICPPVNAERLSRELPNVVDKRLIDYFNHLDFIWAKDADTILYKDVISLINKYNDK